MLAWLEARLTYSNVVATLALFVALGGVSYAAATGSIGSREIENSSVRSKDIRNNDVRTKDVRNRSLLAIDFKAGQLPRGQQGEAGPRGQTGATGPTGPAGATGPPGPTTGAVAGTASAGDEPTFAASSDLLGNALVGNITTTTSSRLLVFASLNASVTCSVAGSCAMAYAIYLDGEPVAGTHALVSALSGLSRERDLFMVAMTPSAIGAGQHEVRVRQAEVNEEVTFQSHSNDARVGAIALGG